MTIRLITLAPRNAATSLIADIAEDIPVVDIALVADIPAADIPAADIEPAVDNQVVHIPAVDTLPLAGIELVAVHIPVVDIGLAVAHTPVADIAHTEQDIALAAHKADPRTEQDYHTPR